MSAVELQHHKSTICADESLQLFNTLPTAVCKESQEDVRVWPTNTITQNSPITFNVINHSANNYINICDSFITFQVRLRSIAGLNALAADRIAFVNGLSSAFIKSISVSVGDTQISNFDSYFLRNALDLLLHTPSIEQQSVVSATQLFSTTRTSATSATTAAAEGLDDFPARAELAVGGTLFEFMCPCNIDIASSCKWLLPGLDIKLNVSLNSPNFYLVGDATVATNFQLVIEDAFLTYQRCSVLPSIALANETILKKSPAIYPIRNVKTCERIIQAGNTRHAFDLNMTPQIPYAIYAVLLPSNIYAGSKGHESLFFQRHDLNRAKLTVQNKSYEYNYTRTLSAYHTLIRSLGEKNVKLTYEDFKLGSFVMHFNLSDNIPKGALRPVKRGTVRLELDFNVAPAAPLHLLIMSETVGHMEIDAARTVSVIV